ncbi:hypothetical protein EK0264_07450 [Epidermidibacterium keratini]|uniref:Uncharacterized protein n=1 Tax=Epidermidibacterium keratini TaxID=1891644 RepID=A0A7L4YLR1_9ACTN|nr:hypothetical protein [Epidermidibacterium keratini]QHC00126.1 hypothetical protein EK0264_07450 [Epidermidibacterium keratini]
MSTDTSTKNWNDRFILRLRARGVSGPEIADSLKTVQTHCADTGESPPEAFGDPVEYAESLGFTPRTEVGAALWGLPAFLGTSFLLEGLVGVIRGEPVAFTGWDFAMWGVVVAFSVLVALALSKLRSPWLVLGGLVGIFLALSAMSSALDAPTLLELEAWILLAAGGVLVAGTVLAIRREVVVNRVSDPVDGSDMLLREQPTYFRWIPAVFVLVMIALVVVLALI